MDDTEKSHAGSPRINHARLLALRCTSGEQTPANIISSCVYANVGLTNDTTRACIHSSGVHELHPSILFPLDRRQTHEKTPHSKTSSPLCILSNFFKTQLISKPAGNVAQECSRIAVSTKSPSKQ